MTDARAVAVHVLERVLADGAFAAAALDAELSRSVQLDARDRGFATELVYGCLRTMGWLVARLDRHAKKPITTLELDVRLPLLIATYQMSFLRVPPHAAVDTAVAAIRRARGPKMGGFANAILRRVAEEKKSDVTLAQATAASCPPEVRAALTRALGDDTLAFLTCGAPPTCLRVDVGTREDAIARIEKERPGARIAKGKASPLAITVNDIGDARTLEAYRDGTISLQEEGSQAVALALGAGEGERVLDACAGRGNKSALLALHTRARIDACDAHPAKLERLKSELARLRVKVNATYAVDWTVGTGDVPDAYDRVLVDAPCSGIGTIRRRPEILLRPMRDVSELQVAIATRAATRLRKGGTLLYAVCSVLREEGEDVIAKLPKDLELEYQARFLPHIHGTDGYFLARFIKR